MDVLGLGLLAYQDDLQPLPLAQMLGAVGIEHRNAGSRARRGRQPLSDRLGLDVGVQTREQHLFQRLGRDAQQRLFLADQPLALHLDRGAHHGDRVHLAVAGLETVELTLLDGELEVLDLVIVAFELVAQFVELVGQIGHLDLEPVERLGRADAGDHVLALGVDQIFAVELVLAGGRIAGEGHAGGRIVATVAEHHGHDIDRRAVGHVRGDVELFAIVDRALAGPGVEDGLDRDLELLIGIGREGVSRGVLDHLEEALAGLAQIRGREIDVLLGVGGLLDGGEFLVEGFVGHAERDLAEELDEAPIGVITEARIVGGTDHALQGRAVEAQVEDGVHHARHRHRRSRAHRDQQRIVRVAEALAGLLLQGAHLLVDLFDQAGRQGALGFVEIFQTGRRGDDESGRDVQPDLGHLAQVGALAAEQLLVLSIAVLERKDILSRSVHRWGPPLLFGWCDGSGAPGDMLPYPKRPGYLGFFTQSDGSSTKRQSWNQ